MSRRGYLILAGVVAVAIAVSVVFPWPSEESAPPPSTRNRADTPAPATEGPGAEEEEAVTPASIPDAIAEPETAPETAEPTSAEESEKGPGRFHGRVSVSTGDPVPADATVSAHFYDAEGETEPEDDAVVKSAQVKPSGEYEIDGLPLGAYYLYTSAGAGTLSMQTSARLTPDNPESEVNINLVPGGAIAGRIVDTARQPVEGARVYVAAYNVAGARMNGSYGRAASSRVTSDAEGRFVMPYLRQTSGPDQGYRLGVKAEGFATYVSDMIPAGTPGVEFVLSQGGIVSGQVIRARSGEAVPDRTLLLSSDFVLDRKSVQTDGEGWFFFAEVPPGEHRAALDDDELVLLPETATFSVSEGEETTDVVLQAAEGGKISGRIYDADSGKGIGGVEVSAFPLDRGLRTHPSGSTDADGNYSFTGLQAGKYTVRRRSAPGYPRAMSSMSDWERLVSVEIEQEMPGVDFAISAGKRISGVVVDSSGRGVAGADVSASARPSGAYDAANSDERGRFVLAGFKEGNEAWIQATKDAMVARPEEPVEVGPDGVTGLRLVLETGAAIEGKVVDQRGRPPGLPDMQVVATRLSSGSSFGSKWSEVGADGRFRVDQLTEGQYALRVSRGGGWSTGDKPAGEVELRKSETKTGVRLVYKKGEGLELTGTVTDVDGNALSNATVQLYSRSFMRATTDGQGKFRFEGLDSGAYTLSVQRYDYSSTQTQAEAGTDVTIVLQGTATIEGEVLVVSSRKPLTQFEVMQTERGGAFEPWMERNFTVVRNEQGQFTLDGVKVGAATVWVRAPGYAPASQTVQGIVARDEPYHVTMLMDVGATVQGRVVSAGGRPVRAARIFVGDLPDPYMRDQSALTRSDSDGRFVLDSVEIGDVQVWADHGDYAPASVFTSTSPGRVSRVEIVLPEGATVRGRVTLGGAPQAGASVTANFSGVNGQRGVSANTQTDTDGSYELTGLPEGTARVYAFLPTGDGSRRKTASAETAPGYVTEVDFDFTAATGAVEGVVLQAPGEVFQGRGSVQAIAYEDNQQESAYAQLDGHAGFTFDALPAGPISLLFSGSDGQTRRNRMVQVSLRPGERLRQDIRLYEGHTVRCTLTNVPEGYTAYTVSALIGEFSRADITESFLQNSYGLTAAMASNFGGRVATLTGLEPGVYTLIAMARNSAPPDPQHPMDNVAIGHAIVQVGNEDETEVVVSF